MIHRFPEDRVFEDPGHFTDPFRYVPHPLVSFAASEVIARIDSDPELRMAFSEGKMLGVLVCEHVCCQSGPQSRSMVECSARPLWQQPQGNELCYIAAFSGNVDGKSIIDGFVPPIYDLTDPNGHFKIREAEITALNRKISSLLASSGHSALKEELAQAERDRDGQLESMRTAMTASRHRRSQIRIGCTDTSVLDSLARESQFEKAELRRLKQSWEDRVSGIRSRLDGFLQEIESLKQRRASMSDELQEWIFRQYKVHNMLGEEASVADIFASEGLVPPGGTGDCAAPKLLEYAFRNGLKPLAMGEFWYGQSPDTAVRTHGHFYPSCTSKCGPLLAFMMKGGSLMSGFHACERQHITVYEDEAVMVVEKPGGMPSVPGLDGRTSLIELLSATSGHLHAVHRLDMDTSGVMVFAKTPEAAVNLHRQFEEHTVRKTYMARICAGKPVGDGHIDLPLSADYDERPRQKVDLRQGRPAQTEYRTVSENADGTADILLYPHTGRTHQLRVHCAHTLGLGRPIVGDLLYGGHGCTSSCTRTNPERLCLHALSITFRHPTTSESVTFTSRRLCY